MKKKNNDTIIFKYFFLFYQIYAIKHEKNIRNSRFCEFYLKLQVYCLNFCLLSQIQIFFQLPLVDNNLKNSTR